MNRCALRKLNLFFEGMFAASEGRRRIYLERDSELSENDSSESDRECAALHGEKSFVFFFVV